MTPKIVYTSPQIDGLLIIQPDAFKDHRGYNFEGYNESVYENLIGFPVKFSVDSYSRSVKDVIRGLHGDSVNWKLIDVLYGSILFVVIDVRKESPTYGNKEEFGLNDENRSQIFLPPGCINGHCVLSKECIFHYKLSTGFVPQDKQISFKWNDPTFHINWPTSTPILAERDK